jgi:hypothetical protein
MSDPFFVHSEYQAEFYGGLIREIDEAHEAERERKDRPENDRSPSFLLEYWRRLAALFGEQSAGDPRTH